MNFLAAYIDSTESIVLQLRAPMYQTAAAAASGTFKGLDKYRYNDYYYSRMGRLMREIKQERPFANVEEEVFLNLQRTADALMRRVAEALKQVDLTPTQYNALRIVRGAGDSGLPCGEVSERMVTRDPDVTRLLDRMEKRGLVERGRDERDRRVVTVRITDAGTSMLATVDPSLSKLLAAAFGHLERDQLEALNQLLEAARGE